MLGVVHLNICTHVISAPSEEPTGVSSEAPQRSNQVCRPCKCSRKKTGSRFPAEQHVNSTDQSGVFSYKLHSHEQSLLPHCRLVGGVESSKAFPTEQVTAPYMANHSCAVCVEGTDAERHICKWLAACAWVGWLQRFIWGKEQIVIDSEADVHAAPLCSFHWFRNSSVLTCEFIYFSLNMNVESDSRKVTLSYECVL